MKYAPIEQIGKSLLLCRKNWVLVPISFLIDIAFLAVFGFFYKLFFFRITEHLAQAVEYSAKQAPTITQAAAQNSIYAAFTTQQFVSTELRSVLFLAVSLGFVTYVLWTLFQSANWLVAYKIANKKIKYFDYLLQFGLANILWCAIAGVIIYVSLKIGFYNALSQNRLIDPRFLTYITLFFMALVGYFAMVSYSGIYKLKGFFRKVFSTSINHAENLAPAYALLIIAAIVLNYIIYLVWLINVFASIVIGAFILLFLLVYSRVYFIELMEKIEKRKG